MTPNINLRILAKRFAQLSNADFFDPAFKDFVARTLRAIEHVVNEEAHYPEPIVRGFVARLWRVSPFISGNRRGDAPHETQFVLKKALNHWVKQPALISSAAHEDFEFYLKPGDDLWKYIPATLDKFDHEGYNPILVQIGFPEAYRHRPTFCTPLFHELGHFVDVTHRITETSIMVAPPQMPPPAGVTSKAWVDLHIDHRREFFADLFSACYSGETSTKQLEVIAPSVGPTKSHPATKDRVDTVRDFLAGRPNPRVELIQATLTARGLPSLAVQYTDPDLKAQFDDALTYRIESEAELFGIFGASWKYLFEQTVTRDAPWIDGTATEADIETTVNDLTEKSIRDFEIMERWKSVTTD